MNKTFCCNLETLCIERIVGDATMALRLRLSGAFNAVTFIYAKNQIKTLLYTYAFDTNSRLWVPVRTNFT